MFVNGRFNDLNRLFAFTLTAPISLPALSVAFTITTFFHPARLPNPRLIRRAGPTSSRVDGTHTLELVVALCHGKEFCFLLAIACD